MSTLGRWSVNVLGPLTTDELIGAISRLLMTAKTSLGTDLFTAKTMIDQASALIDWRAEMKSDLAVFEANALALAPWQMKRLADFVALNMASSIRNADLAAAVGLSRSHLSRAFKQSFGITPQAYIGQYRVQHAKHLMLSTGEPLAQIALACGFADQAHFSTSFRRLVGITPVQWRRAHAECSDGLRHGRTARTRPCANKIEERA